MATNAKRGGFGAGEGAFDGATYQRAGHWLTPFVEGVCCVFAGGVRCDMTRPVAAVKLAAN